MSALTPGLLERLRDRAAAAGVLRLGAVSLGDPGFAPARQELDRHLDGGLHGEMAFMERTRAVRRHPEQMLAGARSVLVGVVPYGGAAGPVARYAQAHDYHTVVHRRLEAVVSALRDARPDVGALICVDTKPLLERAAAVLAGLGFLGKNGCLIVPGLGSYVVIGSVLTTLSWERPGDAVPPALERPPWHACGQCTACLGACPTQAFEAPGRLDARACISYLTIEHRGPIAPSLAEKLGERVAGCDVCQEVCPYNHGTPREPGIASARLPAPPGPPRDGDPLALVQVRSGRYNAFVRHTPLGRIPRRHLRRNAALALGNRSSPLSSQETDALQSASQDPEPLVRDAAQWALQRRRRR